MKPKWKGNVVCADHPEVALVVDATANLVYCRICRKAWRVI